MPADLAPAISRRAIEQQIERHLEAAESLISLLDDQDGDFDLEPSLGSIDPNKWDYAGPIEPGSQQQWAAGGSLDIEFDPCDGPIDDGELESDQTLEQKEHAA